MTVRAVTGQDFDLALLPPESYKEEIDSTTGAKQAPRVLDPLSIYVSL